MLEKNNFEKNGCFFVENFIDVQTVSVVKQYFLNKVNRGEWKEKTEEDDPSSRFAYYADPLIEVILQASQKVVEEITGKELLPTYSYSRIYQSGESLKPHIDRPACEISVTVNVATQGEFSPIYTKYGQNDFEKHILKPGDAVVYKGCDVLHWREELKEGQVNMQFMLHYVDKNGPNSKHEKDMRKEYGYPHRSKRN